MGRPWSLVIMPLLSTLAALVILAHSEEELSRHDLSARLSEPGSPDYDQSWRAVEGPTSLQQQPGPEDWGVEIAPQEPPKRRRPGRKRKRRPQPLTEDSTLEERPYYADGRGLDQDQPETPRRRRKRPEGTPRWTEELQEQRPLRRRGHRRKQRPLTTDTEQNEQLNREDVSTQPHDHETERERTYEHPDAGGANSEGAQNEQITMDDLIARPNEESKAKEVNAEWDTSAADTLVLGPRDVEEMPREEVVTDDKTDKSYRVPYSLARKQEQLSEGTSKIKELLKQSGGLSLSELLQQRNLSLSDLLNGKQNAISALKSDSIANSEDSYREDKDSNQKIDHIKTEEINNINDSNVLLNNSYTAVQGNDATTTTENDLSIQPLSRQHLTLQHHQNKVRNQYEAQSNLKENKTSEFPRRRLPPSGTRRNIRQRIRNPHNESSIVRIRPRYNFMSAHPRRKENLTTTEPTPFQENENIIDVDLSNETSGKVEEHPKTTTNGNIMTTVEEITTYLPTTTMVELQTDKAEANIATENQNVSDREVVEPKLLIPALRPKLLITNSELRRQAITNRHRKKKLRNKAIIPKNAEEIPVQELFGMANLVSASEFITKLQTTEPTPSTTTENDLPDLFTVESTNIGADNIITNLVNEKIMEEPVKKTEITQSKYTTVRTRPSITTARNLLPAATTEESAKEEILEVFKDMQGGARLAKILSERNMTINELVEHRERGSSQIHLADIFHNTSREPNPPEPFLSKSLIEPISKETYPLRALLEANSHDPTVKLTSQNAYSAQFTNIPLIVDYGRNINENGENLGIIALFNEFANSKAKFDNNIKKDSEGTAYFTSVMSLNTTDYNMREGRSMFDSARKSDNLLNNLPILQNSNVKSVEEKAHKMDASSTTQGTTITTGKTYPERDVDGDGLIVLEDLQQLNELDNLAQSINEKLEVNMLQHTEQPDDHQGLLEKIPSGVRSATIASATIVGLTIVLFLMTYIGCKWRKRRKIMLQNSERIPTPVFENRKSNRNCSTRSISPMLASTNGFTMNTLDSQTGKESPEYMWDTLHKPFQ